MAFERNDDQANTRPNASTARTEAPLDEPQRYVNAGRSEAFRSAESGTADKFYETAMKITEGRELADRRLMKLDGDILRQLSPDYGWLTYITNINGNLFWHLLVIETNKEPVERRAIRDKRYRTDVYDYITTIDGINLDIVDMVENWLRVNAPVKGEFVFTSVTVVPAEIDLADMSAVRNFCRSADDANMAISFTDQPFNSEYVPQGAVVRGTMAFQVGADEKDMAGMPQRADFKGDVREVVERTNSNLLLANNRGATYATINGFVNARFFGAEPARRGEPQSLACYIPEVVVTEVNLYNQIKFGNFERMFLGLALLPQLNTNNRWMQQFQANFQHKELRDVAGFGYGLDIQNPDYLNITDEEYADPRIFADTMEGLFRLEEGVDFAYLIREGSVGYANNKLLIDLAHGERGAYDAAIIALDNLTNGVFSEMWRQVGGKVIVADSLRMPTGYYVSSQGQRPIEDIDTLAVLNTLKNNYPDMLNDWFDCTNLGRVQYDYNERMTKLKDIFDLVTHKTFTMKGFATKVYFDPLFLETLYRAVQASGLAMQVEFEGDVGFVRNTRGGGVRYGVANDLARSERRSYDARNRHDDRYAGTSYRRNNR